MSFLSFHAMCVTCDMWDDVTDNNRTEPKILSFRPPHRLLLVGFGIPVHHWTILLSSYEISECKMGLLG